MKRWMLFSLLLSLSVTALADETDDDEIGSFDEAYHLYKGKAAQRRANDKKKHEDKYGERKPRAKSVKRSECDEAGQGQDKNYAVLARESPEVVDSFRHHNVQRHARHNHPARQGNSPLNRAEPMRVIHAAVFVPVILCVAFLYPGYRAMK